MDLFSFSSEQNPSEARPLADKLRPQNITEVLGQDEVIGLKSPLRRLLSQGLLPSFIFWGPPGSGKTTLAQLLAKEIDAELYLKNATDLGVKEIREIGSESKQRKQIHSRNTVLFIDEIHRLNKSQQDYLLPFIEKGDFTLIGATTENPSYELNRALLSRCQVIQFKRVESDSFFKLI